MDDALVVAIKSLGHLGDGIAQGPDGPVYVALALPGETVRIGPGDPKQPDRAELIGVVTPSPARIAPVCRHFGTCGGCVMQHLGGSSYARWKEDVVSSAFRQRGISAEVAPLQRLPPGSRRRIVFSARRTRKTVLLGFHGLRDGAIVPIEHCAVAMPAITAKLPALREIAGAIASRRGEIRLTVAASPAGLDVMIDGVAQAPVGSAFTRVADAAERAGFARLSVNGEVLVELASPAFYVGDIAVVPPPGGFLQAVEEAERIMAAIAAEHLGRAGSIADLFCGSGALTFPLARFAKVTAIDNDCSAIEALSRAARGASGLKPVEAWVRDLFHEPLSVSELIGFDGLVFDPPRAGCEAQARAIAHSAIPRVVAVSCNPSTLARDARILIDGGYRIGLVTPIDQFVFSAHIELVALFDKA